MGVIDDAEEKVLDQDCADCWVLEYVKGHHRHSRPFPFNEDEQHCRDRSESEH